MHKREVKVFHSHLGAVLNVDPQMNLLFIVVLNTKNKAEVQGVGVAILLQHVNQIVKHTWVETLDVLDDENNWLVHSDSLLF